MTHPLAITTNRAEATAVIKAAIEAGRLTALHGLQGTYAQDNNDGVLCHCGIGILYPPLTALALEHVRDDSEDPAASALVKELEPILGGNYAMARDLIRVGLLIVPEDEHNWFTEMQYLQDRWATAEAEYRQGIITEGARNSYREAFLNHL